ncbi:serine/threonine-protein kinase pim-3-like [Sinocyclocheilus anshuiensis]|uniref:serine/threonine-protein kinase pim-3-like n=2 Tax=Sinocyclocheilus anshuiensis TaxID=1608454 RepID=UPI0007B7FE03|nr:PREDICTED: serine/threonine-protein kinase pim-3-like [Sinocyclocheilus anshuiensis]
MAPDTVSPDPEIERPQGSVVSLFEVGHLIASGNFSKVYEGTHIFSDKVKVALKCVPKRRVDRYLDIPGHSKPVLAEVALMLRLGEAPSCPNIMELHQWLEDESSFTLIMEYPEPCRTLEDYILFSGPVSEAQARLFMLQVLQAVKHCHERGVYHGDIRSRNILVTLHSLELKLIDFRCARLISSEGFNSSQYQGSDAYTPPEVLGQSIFHAAAADVWALAVLLFEIIHRYLPFESFDAIQHGYVRVDPTLSTACHDLIFHCLSRNPAHRLTLRQLEEHRWMKA